MQISVPHGAIPVMYFNFCCDALNHVEVAVQLVFSRPGDSVAHKSSQRGPQKVEVTLQLVRLNPSQEGCRIGGS